MVELADRILGCMAVEQASADVYSTLMSIFPGEKDFFEDLYKDELKHSTLFIDGALFDVFGIEKKQVLPPELDLIRKTIDYAKQMNIRIRTSPVSLDEALKMALTLEESMVESFANEVLAGEERIVEGFAEILKDEKRHIEKLRDFMSYRGILKVS